MQLYEVLIKASAAIGAVIGIGVGIAKIVKFGKKCASFFTDTEDALKDLKERQKELEVSLLRITLIDESMPMSERLSAGKKYVELGGNGDCKAKYNELKALVDKTT